MHPRVYFSPSAEPLTFYLSDSTPANVIPADAIEVTPARYMEIINELVAGGTLMIDAKGLPVTAPPPPPPEAVPAPVRVCTRAKGKEALVKLGLFEATKRWVDDYRTPELVRIGFYDADEWKIDSPLIALWRDALSQPQSKVQELFDMTVNSVL